MSRASSLSAAVDVELPPKAYFIDAAGVVACPDHTHHLSILAHPPSRSGSAARLFVPTHSL